MRADEPETRLYAGAEALSAMALQAGGGLMPGAAPRTGRIREFGVDVGTLPCGPLDKITDVPGVTVGHTTVRCGDGPDAVNTGVTAIVPCEDNPFARKLVAAAYVHNGFGKTCGTVQIEELGTLETPIALTNTLCVGRVADALVGHVLDRCEREGVEAFSINPVVGECNDARLNRIARRSVGSAELERAFAAATRDFEEGAVGAGAGTVCFGLKGGIGSASRVVEIGGRDYTVGVLVQSNFGATVDLVVDGRPLGRDIARVLTGEVTSGVRRSDGGAVSPRETFARSGVVAEGRPTARCADALWEVSRAVADAGDGVNPSLLSDDDRGSIMVIVATDLPLDARQLRRLIRRAGVGIARTGGYTGHGSGEVMIGFTTANRIEPSGQAGPVARVEPTESASCVGAATCAEPAARAARGPAPDDALRHITVLREELLDPAFKAVAEATHEAILTSMSAAAPARALNGATVHSLAEFL